MNFSYFLLEKFLDLFYDISLSIQNIGESIFQKNISFSTLINTINSTIYIGGTSRYIMIKVFVLISPFAILSLCLDNTSWFFKAWIKNLFSLLLIQIIVSLILVILFSVNTSNNDLFSKFIYIGGIYALIKANSFVREFIGGISTNI